MTPPPRLRPVSLRPPKEPAHRDAARLIAMVHELHKSGYQRIRILPTMAPTGLHWRCTITSADNVAPDGLSIRTAGNGLIARYTSGQGSHYFDWPGADRMTARQLAVHFLSAFPLIAERGAGRDWPYAGWLTDVLGRAEHCSFVVFAADYPLDEAELREWRPPPVPEDREF